jgi:N-sulfoglucosamine sulfohydrolase
MPFPGAKTTLYAAGIHLPLIIAAPHPSPLSPQGKGDSVRAQSGGRTNDALCNYIDLAPTILDWCGAKQPKYKLPGRSLLPILDQEHPKGWDETYASHQFHEITM